jgi:hypothetical protein
VTHPKGRHKSSASQAEHATGVTSRPVAQRLHNDRALFSPIPAAAGPRGNGPISFGAGVGTVGHSLSINPNVMVRTHGMTSPSLPTTGESHVVVDVEAEM